MHGNIKTNAWVRFNTAEKIRAIIDVYAATEKTAGSIASRLSIQLDCDIPRNSIIGIYTRHKAHLGAVPLTGFNGMSNGVRHIRKERPKTIKPPVVKKTKVAPIKNLTPPKGPELPMEMRFPASPEPFLKTLLEMDSKECRWPVVGHGAGTQFCCHEIDQGRPYCGFHHGLSRGDGTPSERAAHRVSKRNMAA